MERVTRMVTEGIILV